MIQVPEDFFRLLTGVIGIDTLFLQFDIDEYRSSPLFEKKKEHAVKRVLFRKVFDTHFQIVLAYNLVRDNKW